MDSNRIRNVALGARETLMQEVDAALGRVLATDSPERVANSRAVGTIERAIADRGRENVVEQVAYTWFNRLCALRYMDVRGYTPVGLVSPRPGETLPAVLADARRGIYAAGLDISQRDKDAINAVLNGDTTARDPLGRAYVMLLVAACKTYERSMDYLFGAGRDLGPAIELLAPTDLLSEGSLLQRICTGLDEATCNEGVEVMGWLYQFYVSERKVAFFASEKKATAADIAPATQLFTPNWIVCYLVENSLGRLWMLNYPDSELKDHMDYYVEPEEPEEDFLRIYSPEDITFLDPACGSGHILVYAFDLFYLMYEEEGYRPGDIPELIFKNNLTGIEIDDRAAEIASFCLEMKALEKDPGFLDKDVDANIIVTHRFDPTSEQRKLIPKLCANAELMDTLTHFNEVGSLYEPTAGDLDLVREAEEAVAGDTSFDASGLRHDLNGLSSALETLSSNYAVTVTNPPYLKSGDMNPWLAGWLTTNIPSGKYDLCASFILRNIAFSFKNSYVSMITMQSWMTIPSAQALRAEVLSGTFIQQLVLFGAHAFDAISGEVVSTCAFILRPCLEWVACLKRGRYLDVSKGSCGQEKRRLLQLQPYNYIEQASFRAIEGSPIVTDMTDAVADAFEHSARFGQVAFSKPGMQTSDNARFLRIWSEVSIAKVGFGLNHVDAETSPYKWFPYNKGNGFRKWYGNSFLVVNYFHDGEELKYWLTHNPKDPSTTSWSRNMRNYDSYFVDGITYSAIGNVFSARCNGKGFLFDTKGPTIFTSLSLPLICAYVNTSTFSRFNQILTRQLTKSSASINGVPYRQTTGVQCQRIIDLSTGCISLARTDWDAFETSWDFTRHPLVRGTLISDAFDAWSAECQERFDQLKANEEELNLIFARIYGMEDEVPIEVPDDKVSVRLADLKCDVKSLISYGVGCMFGRYSLDEPGLILADEGSTLDDYHAKVPNPTFEPNRTGIIPITDADTEWFEDDIVAQFRRWLAAAYGEGALDENVAFIERALGKSLRAYFVRDFYDNHLKTYRKRPIYWLFQSPKKGLSALVYLHRYNPNTVTTLLTEYIRPLREQMEAQVRLLEVTGNARDTSTATKYRATIDELDKWEHDVIFPLSQKHVALDLDDGVKANYGKPEFKGALRKVTGLN